MSRRYVVSSDQSCQLKCPGCVFTGFQRSSVSRSSDDLSARGYSSAILPCHVLPVKIHSGNVSFQQVIQMGAGYLSILFSVLAGIIKGHKLIFFLWASADFSQTQLFKFLSKVFIGADFVFGLDQELAADKAKLLNMKMQILWALPFEELNYQRLKSVKDSLSLLNSHSILGLDGWDFFEPRSLVSVSREPDYSVLHQRRHSKPKLSVIIPVYNDAKALRIAVSYWAQQTNQDFELIIVDDGSFDDPWAAVGPVLNDLQFIWVQIQRSAQRERGDLSFRAGITRSIGVYHARGEQLLFVDSDIVVPSQTVDTLLGANGNNLFLQAKRWQLSAEAMSAAANYNDYFQYRVDSNSGYWEAFQNMDLAWDQLPAKWRYVSTFFLSLRKSDFESLGWFRKNYIHYGCEDTDLGVRAYENGFSFQRLDLDVFHLPPDKDRSEFQLDERRKKKLLNDAFVQLYRNTLSKEVFEELIDTHLRDDIMDSHVRDAEAKF